MTTRVRTGITLAEGNVYYVGGQGSLSYAKGELVTSACDIITVCKRSESSS